MDHKTPGIYNNEKVFVLVPLGKFAYFSSPTPCCFSKPEITFYAT